MNILRRNSILQKLAWSWRGPASVNRTVEDAGRTFNPFEADWSQLGTERGIVRLRPGAREATGTAGLAMSKMLSAGGRAVRNDGTGAYGVQNADGKTAVQFGSGIYGRTLMKDSPDLRPMHRPATTTPPAAPVPAAPAPAPAPAPASAPAAGASPPTDKDNWLTGARTRRRALDDIGSIKDEAAVEKLYNGMMRARQRARADGADGLRTVDTLDAYKKKWTEAHPPPSTAAAVDSMSPPLPVALGGATAKRAPLEPVPVMGNRRGEPASVQLTPAQGAFARR